MKLTLLGQAGPPGSTYRITHEPGGHFSLEVGSALVATSEDPKALSKWAFNHGAFAVKHDYDLGLAERSLRLPRT